MVLVGITFLTGRYHATPWRRHVNEGAVEWPPGPWRLSRALISTGYRKLGWEQPPPAMTEIACALGTRVPRYHLPRGAEAHTRHYMPAGKGKRNKVLDTFVHLGRDDQFVMEWDVELSADARSLLDDLLTNLGYLGRAESWIEAVLLESFEPAGHITCSTEQAHPGAHPIRVLRLLEVPDYLEWRSRALSEERERLLEDKRAKARGRGKSEPKKLGKRDLEKTEALFPQDVIEVLQQDTRTLQSQGWSQPPGTRWATIWRPEDAMRITHRRRWRRDEPGPPFMLLEVRPDTESGLGFPPTTDTLQRAEGLHRELVARASKWAGDDPPWRMTGKRDGALLRGHQHLHVLPLCIERPRGRESIDHILLWIPGGGFGQQSQLAVLNTTILKAHKLPPAALTCIGTGEAEELDRLVPALRSARIWQSVTPFVPPRYLKVGGRNTLLGQVQAELESRRLPVAVKVEVEVVRPGGARVWMDGGAWSSRSLDRLSPRFRHFRVERDKEGREPKQRLPFALRLHFDEPVRGPICLGYASHFGLGQFAPE